MAVISFLTRMVNSNLHVHGLEMQPQATGTLGNGKSSQLLMTKSAPAARNSARPAMRVGRHRIGVKAMFYRPLGPNALDSGGGVDEDAVKIEQKCTTPECG